MWKSIGQKEKRKRKRKRKRKKRRKKKRDALRTAFPAFGQPEGKGKEKAKSRGYATSRQPHLTSPQNFFSSIVPRPPLDLSTPWLSRFCHITALTESAVYFATSLNAVYGPTERGESARNQRSLASPNRFAHQIPHLHGMISTCQPTFDSLL